MLCEAASSSNCSGVGLLVACDLQAGRASPFSTGQLGSPARRLSQNSRPWGSRGLSDPPGAPLCPWAAMSAPGKHSRGGGGRDGEDQGAAAPPARDTVTCFKKQLLLEAGLEVDRQPGIPTHGSPARVSCSLPGHPGSVHQHLAPPGTMHGVLEPHVSRGFGDSAVAPSPFPWSLSDARTLWGRGDAGGLL